jgi:polyhydroxyalkanoate synthesis regulator phasin
MQEAWRAYLELAMGVTDASRKKANKTVKRLIGKGGATAEQLRDLAGELVATGTANREALAKMVRFEVDRALGAVGLATAEEVTALTAKVQDLERQLREAREGEAVAPVSSPPATKTVGTKAVGTKAVGTKAVATKAVAKKAVATKAVAKKAIAKKTAAKKTAATKSALAESGRASPASKAAPKKAAKAAPAGTSTTGPAKRATAKKTAGGAP